MRANSGDHRRRHRRRAPIDGGRRRFGAFWRLPLLVAVVAVAAALITVDALEVKVFKIGGVRR